MSNLLQATTRLRRATAFFLLVLAGPAAALEATKSAGAVTHVGDNEFQVTFTLSITNNGANPEYFDVQAFEDLAAELGTAAASVGDVDAPGEFFAAVGAVDTSGVVGGGTAFVLNPGFDGDGDTAVFDVSGGGASLQVGDVVSVPITVRFLPQFFTAPYTNEFTAAADLAENLAVDSTVTDLAPAVALDMVGALTPFGCASEFYIGSASLITDPTDFFSVDPATAIQTPVGSNAHGLHRNASGYRDSDDLIYSIQGQNNNLMVTDANGVTVVLGDVPTLPAPPNPNFYSAGDVIGNLLYVTQSNSTNLWAVNIDTLVATLQGAAASLNNTGDIAASPVDGQLYHVDNDQLYRINPATAAETAVGTGVGIGPTTFGSTFMDNQGNMYGYLNNGELWIVNTTTGTGALVATGAAVSFNDGAACPSAAPPFEIEVGAAKELASLTDLGSGVLQAVYNLRIENSGDITLSDIQATDDLTAAFGAPQAGIGDVDVAGEYFAAVTTIDTAGITNGGNTSFSAGPYNGSGATAAVLDASQAGTLAGGDFLVITITVTFVPDAANAPFDNQFTASGDATQNGTADAEFTDVSTNGTDPDQNGDAAGNDGDGDPTNTSSVTPLTLPDFDNDTVADVFDVDDDNDGILDTDEGNTATNTDGDAVPDSRDIDADGDGVPDNIEAQAEGSYVAPTGVDTDGDGLDNAYDADNGGTPIVIANTDGADDPDYIDTDSDNDGILDSIEGHDADADGVADVTPAAADADGDGLDDNYDTVVLPAAGNATGSNAPLQNTDGADNRDWRDTDDDNDSVDTLTEGGVGNDGDGDGTPDYLDGDDADADGVPDTTDVDDDNDGIPDATEGAANTDGDAVANSLDIDSDNDGIPDNIEAQAEGSYVAPTGVDTDGDGLDNAYDPDNGGTPIVIANTDGADDPDYIDTDSDNDGILDSIEGHDADSDGVADVTPAAADADGDGLDDNYDTVVLPAAGNPTGSNAPLQNTDGADNRDWRDTDDDNDTVDTLTEGGVGNDADGDGTPDYLDAPDFDEDGVPDITDVDDDNDGILDVDEGAGNTDGDAVADAFDIDSDNDGIPDNIEAQAEGSYVAPTGVDTDGDGLDNAYDADNGGTPIVIANTDGADDPDYLDTDSDNDGILDSIEGHDADRDGVADVTPAGADADGDGLDDNYDNVVAWAAGNSAGSNAPLQNSDAAGNRDWRDTDDDGDGVDTITEGGVGDDADGDGTPDYLDADDVDGDGVPDTSDTDNDNDGIPDAVEGNGDSDLDGVPDNLDIDSDNDGVPDNIEAQTDAGYVAPTGTDTDGDGLDDAYDTDNGGTAITPVNTDGTDNPDYLDDDSDNDGFPDATEAHDPDGDGAANAPFPTGTDADGDGLDDGYDTVVGPAPNNSTGTNAAMQNSDGDDNRDWRDADDDNDGVDSATEGNADTDLDGRADRLDIDADGDGIVDNIEFQGETGYIAPSGNDTDGDGLDDAYDPDNGGTTLTPVNTDGADTADYLDTDSDNDTVPDAVEGHDANFDGVADATPAGADADNDGLDDAFDTVVVPAAGNPTGSNAPLQNTDGADNRDWRDTDDDEDGTDTAAEDTNANGDPRDDDADGDGRPDYLDLNSLVDTDGDGLPDNVDADSDGDGVLDVDEGNGTDPSADTDGDGVPDFQDPDAPGFVDGNADGVDDRFDADGDGLPNHLDVDADNDGVPDNIEAQGGAGTTPPSGTDADNDGIDDAYDPDQGGTAITPSNSDGADSPDFLDDDSDNDGVPDAVEANDADMDGVADTTPAGTDADGDGLDDAFDTVNGFGPGNATGSNAPIGNTDGTDTPDYIDDDEDNDGVPTVNEDANGDGNYANDDRDSDGIPDYLDAVLDIAELSGTAFRDLDSDGVFDATDTPLESWVVELVQNGMVIATTTVAADGTYSFADLVPGTDYEVRVRHPVSNVTYELIDSITLGPGDNLLNQNLPVDPSGVVYDTDIRTPVAGATVTTVDGSGTPLPDVCVLPGQQNQVTDLDGGYKVDLVLGADPACPSGVTIELQITAPAGYVDPPSAEIPPQAGPFDPTGQPSPLLVQPQDTAPQRGDDTTYYLQFVLEGGDPDVIHNHVPLDPVGVFDVRLTKSTSKGHRWRSRRGRAGVGRGAGTPARRNSGHTGIGSAAGRARSRYGQQQRDLVDARRRAGADRRPVCLAAAQDRRARGCRCSRRRAASPARAASRRGFHRGRDHRLPRSGSCAGLRPDRRQPDGGKPRAGRRPVRRRRPGRSRGRIAGQGRVRVCAHDRAGPRVDRGSRSRTGGI